MSDEPRKSETPATPRWVKVFGAVALTGLVALVILFASRTGHGPGQHTLDAALPAQASTR